MSKSKIYLIGVLVVGAIYGPLKGNIPDWSFFTINIGILFLFRFLAEKFGRQNIDIYYLWGRQLQEEGYLDKLSVFVIFLDIISLLYFFIWITILAGILGAFYQSLSYTEIFTFKIQIPLAIGIFFVLSVTAALCLRFLKKEVKNFDSE